jgi:glycosyltransferase involved in cell wall biosynthesis
MGKKTKNDKKSSSLPVQLTSNVQKQLPFVSICTPTFNRRPFIPIMIECFNHQTYPKDRMEWIIIDDGTDKVGDMLHDVPQIKYFSYDTKMTLGKKRNLMHEKSKGDILVYMDDDDYYPPERVSHAVETLLKNPHALCCGSSEMYIFFKHIQKMYQFGPYGPNHATAATFAFHRKLLSMTKYDEHASLAEEKAFLKDYTVPFVQLDPMKSILVFSHVHNSFDKKILLNQLPNPYVKECGKLVDDFVKEDFVKQFFLEDIDEILGSYDPGKPENKPDVLRQMEEITKKRELLIQQQQQMQQQQQIQQQLHQNHTVIQQLLNENAILKEKIAYLEGKIKIFFDSKIAEKKEQLQLS